MQAIKIQFVFLPILALFIIPLFYLATLPAAHQEHLFGNHSGEEGSNGSSTPFSRSLN